VVFDLSGGSRRIEPQADPPNSSWVLVCSDPDLRQGGRSGPRDGDGTFTYTPFAIFDGTDSFDFNANDGAVAVNADGFGATDTGTVTITVP
jgi:hypothetical protein